MLPVLEENLVEAEKLNNNPPHNTQVWQVGKLSNDITRETEIDFEKHKVPASFQVVEIPTFKIITPWLPQNG